MSQQILMVDDDPDFRSAIRTILEKEDYDCIEASSTNEGLRLSSQIDLDLILLDVMMEDIASGFRFMKERQNIEDQNAEVHIPILMITSIQKITALDFEARIKEYLFSTDDFMTKPVSPKELLLKIKKMVQKRSDG